MKLTKKIQFNVSQSSNLLVSTIKIRETTICIGEKNIRLESITRDNIAHKNLYRDGRKITTLLEFLHEVVGAYCSRFETK